MPGPLKNARHERFAQELAKGKSQLEAYRLAGYKPVEANASRLIRNDKVAARVEELKGKAAEKAVVTAADIANQLEEDRKFAMECKSPSAAVSATMGKAKVLGLIVDKTQRELSEEQMRMIIDLVKSEPGMAERLLAQLS